MPGGRLRISVPDMEVLCQLFLHPNAQASANEQFKIMRMMMGGQIEPFDFHKVGFSQNILIALLKEHGFKDFRRVDDFRLCCRTFHLGWPLRFLYWNMNYHIEHHMYPAVPFHQLPRLHAAIRHDLPHIHRGLLPVWREIFAVVRRQRVDPAFRLRPELPVAAAAVAGGPDS